MKRRNPADSHRTRSADAATSVATLAAALDDLDRFLGAAGVGAPQSQREQFQAYIETLLLWQPRVSLTAAATPQSIVRDHIVDSIEVVTLLRPGMRIADVGSGAGFPGLPVAITCPLVRVTLIEARRKRANFLRDAVRRIGASNAEVIEGRVETLASREMGCFDVVVCRALGPLGDFLRAALRLLKGGGIAVAMKGPRGVAEAGATTSAEYGEPEVVRYRLPNGAQRMLLVYRRR